MPHRIEGVLSKHALRNRYPVNQMDTIPGDAIHLGKRRDKGESVRTGCIHHGCQLGTDVAPQGGIGLFVYAADAGCQRMFRRFPDYGICLLRPQMAGFGIHDQNLQPIVCSGKIKGGICYNAGRRTACGKPHTGIQRAGKIIGYDQKFDHAIPPCCLYLKHAYAQPVPKSI